MDQGTIIIDPEEYPKGFILVLVASAHGDICGTTRYIFIYIFLNLNELFLTKFSHSSNSLGENVLPNHSSVTMYAVISLFSVHNPLLTVVIIEEAFHYTQPFLI
jgi:hypothetical protein